MAQDDCYITVNINNKVASKVAVLPADNVRAKMQHVPAPGPCSYFLEVDPLRLTSCKLLLVLFSPTAVVHRSMPTVASLPSRTMLRPTTKW